MPRVILLAVGFVWFAQAATAAPMVLHRGNTAEPETLDPQKTYIDQTGNIVLDLWALQPTTRHRTRSRARRSVGRSRPMA